ncbi:MAG TPA: hypothetical protein VFF13_02195 [archaeon]|nr:hypothetical protein [archaeon]
MEKTFFALAILSIIALSGCIQQNNGEACAQVITPAIGPDGTCKEFPTPCDVPTGYTLTDACEMNEVQTVPPEQTQPTPPEQTQQDDDTILDEIFPQKFDFESELKFCEYNSLVKKTTMFYQIKNQTDNKPTYGAKIWLNVPEIDYEQAKTIQGRYDKGQILWEEQSYDHIDYGRLRGQYWEIRNQDTNQALDFQLIYCEPEIEDNDEKCTEQNGIMILEGKTDELCEGI